MFVETTFRDSEKVKTNRNYVLKYIITYVFVFFDVTKVADFR